MPICELKRKSSESSPNLETPTQCVRILNQLSAELGVYVRRAAESGSPVVP